jgi:hypothetical protein
MSTIKTLTLAGFAALSLGVGTAMAQEGGPSMPGPDSNYGPIGQYHRSLQLTPNESVQSGSSDVDTSPWRGSGARTDSPYYDHADNGG